MSDNTKFQRAWVNAPLAAFIPKAAAFYFFNEGLVAAEPPQDQRLYIESLRKQLRGVNRRLRELEDSKPLDGLPL